MASTTRSLTRAALRSSTSSLRTSTRLAAQQHSRRAYSSSNSSSSGSSSTALPWLIGAGLAIGGGAAAYTFYGSSSGLKETQKPVTPGFEDYQEVYDYIAKLLVEKDDYDDGSYGPVLLRLGWHASGTFDASTQTGGSNGATMRFAPESSHGANAGLLSARSFLSPVKAAFPWLTHSDLWTLAAVVAVQEMQGPRIPWRPGRSDRDDSYCTPDGRLPNAALGGDHLRAIFGRMGFDDREIVALSGAHALGRCHKARSGYEGPWTFSPTVLTNEYYKLLLNETWAYKKWDGPRQFEDTGSGSLMMLPTDMVLIQDKRFREHVERYAGDGEVFFREFADVLCRLLELGVPFKEGVERWRFRSSFD